VHSARASEAPTGALVFAQQPAHGAGDRSRVGSILDDDGGTFVAIVSPSASGIAVGGRRDGA
jgi:hypothetical protein